MNRLTFNGLFCDIAMCGETPGGTFCEDGACSQRKVWERLKALEDIVSDKNGQYDLEDINFILNEEIVEWRKLGPLGAVQSLVKADC